jgi:uncharacterized membrane protein YfcA
MNPTDIIGGLVAGGVGGIASGFLGITSGGILVPLLVLLLGKDQHVAQGISLVAQVLPTSLSGVRNYHAGGHRVSLRWLIWMATGFAIGGCVGALLATRVPDRALQWTFVGYLAILLAIVILRPARAKVEGLALMAGFMKISQHRSQAMSLAVTALPVTLPAALLYVQQGTELPWATIVALIVGLWIGTGIGARLANLVSPDKLRVAMMIVIGGIAIFMAFKASR